MYPYLIIFLLLTGLRTSSVEVQFVSEDVYQSDLREYQLIWKNNKKIIVKSMESLTNLMFNEESNKIKAILIDGPSHSGIPFKVPMRLRHSYPIDAKLGALVHELGHRLIFKLTKKHPNLDSHQILFLFLYDAWVLIRDKEFADRMVNIEKQRSKRYSTLWDEALRLNYEGRRASFKEIPK